MKKLVLIALFSVALFATASAQWVNLDDKTSFNYIAPDGATSTVNEILFPIADTQAYDYDTEDTVTITQDQMFHIFNVDTLEGSLYVNITVDSQVTPGAVFLGKFPADASERKVYFNTGFYTDSVTVGAATTAVPTAIYDGTSFRIIQ